MLFFSMNKRYDLKRKKYLTNNSKYYLCDSSFVMQLMVQETWTLEEFMKILFI